MSGKHFFPSLLLLLLVSLFGRAQNGTLAISYGQMAYKQPFLQQLRTVDNYTFDAPVQLIGISSNGKYYVNRQGKTDGHFLLEQVIPQNFRVNDTVSGKLSGMLFGCGVGWDLFPKNETADFLINGGIQIGRLKVRQSNFNQYEKKGNPLHRKNMFIAPKLSAIFTLNFKKFSVFVQADYAYDVSDPRWKEKILALGKPSSVPLPDFRQTGLLFHIGIVSPVGWYKTSDAAYEEDDINY